MGKRFDPYFAACELGATFPNGGINWSYARFDSKEKMETFAEQCDANGYRTRNAGQIDGGQWAVQYHHYAD